MEKLKETGNREMRSKVIGNKRKTYQESDDSLDEDPFYDRDDDRDADFVQPPQKIRQVAEKSVENHVKEPTKAIKKKLTPKERLQRLEKKTKEWNEAAYVEQTRSGTDNDRQMSFKGVNHNHYFDRPASNSADKNQQVNPSSSDDRRNNFEIVAEKSSHVRFDLSDSAAQLH